jgi:hypothetical protein
MNSVNSENYENESNIMKDNSCNNSELALEINLFVIYHDDISLKKCIKPDSNDNH